MSVSEAEIDQPEEVRLLFNGTEAVRGLEVSIARGASFSAVQSVVLAAQETLSARVALPVCTQTKVLLIKESFTATREATGLADTLHELL